MTARAATPDHALCPVDSRRHQRTRLFCGRLHFPHIYAETYLASNLRQAPTGGWLAQGTVRRSLVPSLLAAFSPCSWCPPQALTVQGRPGPPPIAQGTGEPPRTRRRLQQQGPRQMSDRRRAAWRLPLAQQAERGGGTRWGKADGRSPACCAGGIDSCCCRAPRGASAAAAASSAARPRAAPSPAAATRFLLIISLCRADPPPLWRRGGWRSSRQPGAEPPLPQPLTTVARPQQPSSRHPRHPASPPPLRRSCETDWLAPATSCGRLACLSSTARVPPGERGQSVDAVHNVCLIDTAPLYRDCFHSAPAGRHNKCCCK